MQTLMPSLLAPSRHGHQNPSKFLQPEETSNRFSELEALVNAGGFRFLAWQRLVVASWLGVDEAGRWAARSCGAHVPRQNGKTLGTTVPRMNWGALALNELVLYTSHLQKTSTETFEDVAGFFDQKKFRKYLKTIRTALGREEVIFKNGGRIKFLARTRNGGRGQHADLLVFDEDQELTDEQQASFLPCLAASANPQILYTGTPPDSGAPGTVARRVRDRALEGAPNIAYSEWSVDDISDVMDRDLWYQANPSLGILIQESTVETESIDMAADKFARERLGWWSPTSTEIALEPVINPEAWGECANPDDPPKTNNGVINGVGVKFSVDGSRVTIAVCIRPKTGKPFIEVAKAGSTSAGTRWVARWLLDRRDRIASASIDGKRGERCIQMLNDEKFPRQALHTPGSRDVASACSMLVDAVEAREIEHYAQGDLDAAATTCTRRRIGMDGFGFEDTETGDSTLIEACALAYREAMTTKRRPGRKAVIY